MRVLLLCLSLLLAATPSMAEGPLGLAAPREVSDSGLLKHILPRFSLKTGIRVIFDETGVMQLAKAPPGDPVFARDGQVFYLRIGADPRQMRFRDWLLSDIGIRTIETFKPAQGAPFSATFDIAVDAAPETITGDAAKGAVLSRMHCGRCHVIGAQNRMGGLGSTPSFPVLRTLPDWRLRFEQFFALNPHPAFTQIDGVTPPFDPERPSPIVPVSITIEDLEAIVAFVAATDAADLGAPLQHQ